jgi:hypothetical protein
MLEKHSDECVCIEAKPENLRRRDYLRDLGADGIIGGSYRK